MASTRDKFANGKVKDLSGGRVHMVDKAVAAKMHASILADEFKIPAGDTVVLRDGDTALVRLSHLGDVWSKCVELSGAPVAP